MIEESKKTETKAMSNRTHKASEQVAKSLENSRSVSADKVKMQYDVVVEPSKASLDECAFRSYVASNEPDNRSLVTET